jgi:hypothetical protein
MAYNNKNKLLYYKQIQDETQKHFIPDVTTYAGVFDKYIKPFFPMCYDTYMKIINTNVDKLLKEVDEKQ